MGILFYFLSALHIHDNSSPSTVGEDPPNLLLPTFKDEQELRVTCVRNVGHFVGPILFSTYQELLRLIRKCYTEGNNKEDVWYRIRNCMHDIFNIRGWTFQWAERYLFNMLQYEATLLTMSCYNAVASTCMSNVHHLLLNQHPFYRSRFIASKDSNLVSVMSGAFIMSLWGNVLFSAANLTVQQILQCVGDRMNRIGDDGDDCTDTRQSSSKLLYKHILRYICSVFGSSIGTGILPGWGTLAGIGIADGLADLVPTPRSSDTCIKVPPTKPDKSAPSNQRMMVKPKELLCNCCQIHYFTANTHHPLRVPISSRTCEHTICKSCVNLCHVTLMKRSNVPIDYIKCPLCNSEKAFMPGDLLINRSLCDAILLLEKCGSIPPSCDVDIDASLVEELGVSGDQGSSQSTIGSSDTLSV